MDESSQKPRRRGAEKRRAIRHAAYACFRDRGYHEASVDAICKLAGISKGGFYWHYGSKQEVFVDILETWSREVMDELLDQFEAALSEDDYALAVTQALAREVRRGRAIVPLWLEFTVHGAPRAGDPAGAGALLPQGAGGDRGDAASGGAGRFTTAELQGVAATIFGAYAGLMMQDLSDPEWANATESTHQLMQVLGRWFAAIERIAPPPPSSPDGEPGASASTTAPAQPGQRAESRELTALLNNTSPDAWRRVADLRDLVLRIAPQSDERVIGGWKVVGYEHGGTLFCYLKPRPENVHLGFYQGDALPDPEGLLTGRGKHRRRVELPMGAPLPTRALEALVRAALAQLDA